MECVYLDLGWLLVELDGAAGQSLLLLIVWLDRAVLELRKIGDMLTLLQEGRGHTLLILRHLVLLLLELRILLHVLALHWLLLRHWLIYLVMMVYLGSRCHVLTLIQTRIELSWAWYGLQKLVIRVYGRLIGGVKSTSKRIIFLLLLNDEAVL